MLHVAVEGRADEIVVSRLMDELGRSTRLVIRCGGRPAIEAKVPAFNRSATRLAWFVLADLDQNECAPGYLAKVLPQPERLMRFRIAVRETEAWLLADDAWVAEFFRIKSSLVPTNPERLRDPKRALVDLARKSRRSDVREGMVPRVGSSADVGPLYLPFVAEFVLGWAPSRAASRADSLKRCISAIQSLPN